MDKKQPAISVIVPVYNAEKYLHRCIDSILNQIFTDFEVLLINDGSTDSSSIICDEYAIKDSRIRIFHKENGGVASSRNMGIKHMEGIYSIHVDSDDWVEPNYLSSLYAESLKSNADIVWCDFNEVSEDKIVISNQYSLDNRTAVCDLLLGKMHGSLCNKLIRNKLLVDCNITFLEGVDLWEDLYCTILCFYYSNKVSYINKSCYNYRIDSIGSITDNVPKDINKILMKVRVAEELEKVFYNKDHVFFCYYISLRLRAKSELILFKHNFSPELWNKLLPVSSKLIVFSNEVVRLKLVYLFARNRVYFIPKLYIYLKYKLNLL